MGRSAPGGLTGKVPYNRAPREGGAGHHLGRGRSVGNGLLCYSSRCKGGEREGGLAGGGESARQATRTPRVLWTAVIYHKAVNPRDPRKTLRHIFAFITLLYFLRGSPNPTSCGVPNPGFTWLAGHCSDAQ